MCLSAGLFYIFFDQELFTFQIKNFFIKQTSDDESFQTKKKLKPTFHVFVILIVSLLED